jgi:predicted metalloprotease with PDZ domain
MEVKLEVPATSGTATSVRMARSSPGRYALHEFAKNVYAVKAFDSSGQPLKLSQPNPHEWQVPANGQPFTFQYTVFGNHADGTYAQIDRTHAHLNLPATLAYVPALQDQPVKVRFQLPEGSSWKIATQLKPEPDGSYSAPNLQLLMDSPTELADFGFREWLVKDAAREQTIQLAVHHPGTEAELEKYTDMAKKIVAEELAIFGELPKYDNGRYTFIGCYVPQASGDGMEHRNSTFLTSSSPLSTSALDNAGTLSHEFFHAWNVERIRPKSLEPFKFGETNMSGELWFAEGFTSYYGDLVLHRAGLFTQDQYLASLSGDLNRYFSSPGARQYSPVEMSRQAPFVDAARSVDPTNRVNSYLSYYTYGSALGACLDLTLRARTPAHTLDEYMKAVWLAHGKTEKPYTLNDLEKILGEVTGDHAFAAQYFLDHMYGTKPIHLAAVLEPAGFYFRPKNNGKAWLGFASWAPFKEGGLILENQQLKGTPLYVAGLEQMDALLTVDGKKVNSKQALDKILGKHKPGDVVMISYRPRGSEKTAKLVTTTLKLEADPTMDIVAIENAGGTLSESQKQFRQSWLGSKRTP